MPLYEYVCQKCGNILEVLQSYGQNQAGEICPVCQSQELVKKISTVNINRSTSGNHVKEGSCCGGSERSASCPPGGCCGNKSS